jgi:hypothetical protein
VRRYSRAMTSGVLVPPTAAPLVFDVLDCHVVGHPAAASTTQLTTQATTQATAPRRWRLRGQAADGRRLWLDFDAREPAAGGGPPLLPARLTRATVAPQRGWSIHAEQGQFELGAVRLFVHEDVSAQAALAVPPRAVPLSKRLFWRAVFALLATRAGRRWLERRAAA